MSCCRGCKERHVGCRKTCERLLVQNILDQPRREEETKRKDKEFLIGADFHYRTSLISRKELLKDSPVRCKKR